MISKTCSKLHFLKHKAFFLTIHFLGLAQTDPPTVAISDLFPDGNFPLGEVWNYTDEYVKTPVNVPEIYAIRLLLTSGIY